MNFRELVAQDNVRVFGNTNEFADLREIILESRPFAAPQNYSPWIYAANVVA